MLKSISNQISRKFTFSNLDSIDNQKLSILRDSRYFMNMKNPSE